MSFKKNNNKLEIYNQPNEFFYKLISDKFRDNKILVSKEVEFYIVNLLSRFLKSDNFFSIDSNGKNKNDPLVFLIKEAEDERNTECKKLLYRQVGDVALYSVGIMSNETTLFSYYSHLGKSAYSSVALLYEKRFIKNMYHELSYSFDPIVNSLREISFFKND